jgi:holo-[acyl-carrier protein] synthase
VGLFGESVILGIGIDLVDVARFSRIAERHDPGFLRTLFGEREIAWCRARRRPLELLAVRFAAREALLKAIGTGLIGRMSWRDIEVVSGPVPGVAEMRLGGEVAVEAARRGVARVHVALTTTRTQAAAVVMVEGDTAADDCRRPEESAP